MKCATSKIWGKTMKIICAWTYGLIQIIRHFIWSSSTVTVIYLICHMTSGSSLQLGVLKFVTFKFFSFIQNDHVVKTCHHLETNSCVFCPVCNRHRPVSSQVFLYWSIVVQVNPQMGYTRTLYTKSVKS